MPGTATMLGCTALQHVATLTLATLTLVSVLTLWWAVEIVRPVNPRAAEHLSPWLDTSHHCPKLCRSERARDAS